MYFQNQKHIIVLLYTYFSSFEKIGKNMENFHYFLFDYCQRTILNLIISFLKFCKYLLSDITMKNQMIFLKYFFVKLECFILYFTLFHCFFVLHFTYAYIFQSGPVFPNMIIIWKCHIMGHPKIEAPKW